MTNALTPEEVEVARREWRDDREACAAVLREQGRPETEQGWIEWCEHCLEEWGEAPLAM